MPRGRPRKNPDQVKDKEEPQIEDYVKQFTKASLNMAQSNLMQNVFLQNGILKNLNMSPLKIDREKVEELIANPQNNEQSIRGLAQHLENVIIHFKKVVHHFATILTFDHYIEPTNADDEDFKTPAFKKSEKKALDWLERFDVKGTLTQVMRLVMLQDAQFYYVRDSEIGIALQEMPANYCKIVRKTDYGYQYSFNMMYFLQIGVNLADYSAEFQDYYDRFFDNRHTTNKNPFSDVTTETVNGKFFYWQELDPIKAPVFKWDENRAGIVPPLMGLFPDTVDIATYKELLKTKTKLEVWKILFHKIPLHNDGKGAKIKNDFAIDATKAGEFNALIQAALPDGTKSITIPFDTDVVDFDQSQGKNSIAGIGEDSFYRAAGTSPSLFGEKNTNGTGLEASIKTDEAWVDFMYRQFERFINHQLKLVTGKYRFKIHLEGTRFDQKDRFERAFKAATSGAPKTYLATAMGKTPQEFINLSRYENSLNMVELMKPLISAHTQSDGGAPNKNQADLSASGVKSKDNGSNNNG